MTADRLVTEMRARLADIPGIEFNFSQPIKDNIEENISGMNGQIAIKLFGDDLGAMRRAAEDVRRVLATVPGVADLAIVQSAELPQVHIVVDRQAMARYGLNVADVQEVVETAIGGTAATSLWEGERHFDVVVRLTEASRATLDRLPVIRVATPDGAQVPLAQLARVEVAPGQASITREANMRFIGIRCDVQGRDMGGLVAEAQRRVAAEVKLPPNSLLTWGGEFENQRRAMARLAIIIPVSIALILAILFHTFGSLRCALLILATIPFALVGGVVGLDVAGLNLSVSACIGFIALMGQVVLNGVVLVSQINALRAEGLGLRAAVEAGATRRLRAVLMTALLAALGLLPAALSTQIGSETQRPLAVVVIGGLVSATLLTLLVLPVLYTLVLSERGVRDVPRVLRRRDEALPAAARRREEAAAAERADLERRLAFELRARFVALLEATERLRLARENLEHYRETVRVSEARAREGDISRAEIDKIALEQRGFEREVADAEGDRREAVAALLPLVGVDAADVEPVGALALPPAPEGVEQLVSEALVRRPDLRAAERAEGAAEAALRLARAERWPNPTLGVQYTHSEFLVSGDLGNQVGTSVSVPLPVFNRNQGEIERAEAEALIAHHEVEKLRLSIPQEVRSAVASYAIARERAQRFEDAFLRQAGEARHAAEVSYREGAVSLLEFLEAERTWVQTEREHLSALRDANTAAFDLTRAAALEVSP